MLQTSELDQSADAKGQGSFLKFLPFLRCRWPSDFLLFEGLAVPGHMDPRDPANASSHIGRFRVQELMTGLGSVHVGFVLGFTAASLPHVLVLLHLAGCYLQRVE